MNKAKLKILGWDFELEGDLPFAVLFAGVVLMAVAAGTLFVFVVGFLLNYLLAFLGLKVVFGFWQTAALVVLIRLVFPTSD